MAGIPVVSPAPNVRHQIASNRLAYIRTGAAPEPLIVVAPPVDWVLRAERPAEVRQPDIVVVHPDQLDRRAIRGVPLLAVEILSPWSVERGGSSPTNWSSARPTDRSPPHVKWGRNIFSSSPRLAGTW